MNIVINGKKILAFDCNTLAYRKGNDDNQFISVGEIAKYRVINYLFPGFRLSPKQGTRNVLVLQLLASRLKRNSSVLLNSFYVKLRIKT